MMSKQIKHTIVAVTILGLFVGCGGSESETPVVPTVAEESGTTFSIADIPSLQPWQYDFAEVNQLAAKTAGKSAISQKVSGLPSDEGTVPPAWEEEPAIGTIARNACEINNQKWQLFQSAGQIETFMCYIKTIDQASDKLSVPNNKWAYYSIKFPSFPGSPSPYLKTRIGQFGNELKLNVCASDDGLNFVQAAEMHYTISKGTGFSGHVSRRIDKSGLGTEIQTERINYDLVGANKDNFDTVDYTHLVRYADVAGNLNLVHSQYAADAKKAVNSFYTAASNTVVGWGTSAFTAGQYWDANLHGANKINKTSIHRPPTEDECVAMGVSEDYLHLCAGYCDNADNNSVVPVDESGLCTLDKQSVEAYSFNDKSGYPYGFSIADKTTSAFYAAINQEELNIDTTEALKFTAFDESWDCTSSSGFTHYDATSIEDQLGTCGEIYPGAEFDNCDEEQWAWRQSQ